MKITRKIICTFLIIAASLLWLDNYTFSSLKDFKEGTEKSKTKRKTGSGSSSSSGGCFEELFAEIGALIVELWFVHNTSVHYSDYPYSDSMKNNFIDYIFPKTKKNTQSHIIEENDIILNDKSIEDKNEKVAPDKNSKNQRTNNSKNYYYTLEGGGLYCGDNGNGYFVAIRGKFWKIIGPEIEFRHVDNDVDTLNLYTAGVNISIIQTSGFISDFYIQSASMRGILELDGFAFGAIINSYPYKPFSFMFRIGKHIYSKGQYDIKFIDLEARIGVLYNRFELFAGYRSLKTEYASLKGPLIGLKLFL